MGDFERIFELIRYDKASPSSLEDGIIELSAILGAPLEQAERLTKQTLGSYHREGGTLSTEISEELGVLIAFITQQYRIPFMVERMAGLLDRLGDISDKEVLDYGAGGGRDTILFAKLAKAVTFADFPDLMTPMVKRRFQLRGLTNIEMRDVRRLDGRRYDIVNCMDVVEHVYDVEDITADLIARLRPGGHLLCWPCFVNTWNGDHIEKNCGYLPYYTDMLLAAGLEPVAPVPARDFGQQRGLKPSYVTLYHLRRTRPIGGSVAQERETIRQELYRLSLDHSARVMRWCRAALPFSKLARKDLARLMADNLHDNYAINRLSRQRLAAAA